MSKTSAIKNKEAVDILVKLKGNVDLQSFTTYFIKCLLQNSNYEEIIANVDYLHYMELPLASEPICQLLMYFIEYDDWVHFKKYFMSYFESKSVSEPTIKKIISALVEKQCLELLRFVVRVTMKEKDTFMSLKLTENQYKFIILSLVKSHMDLSAKLQAQVPQLEVVKKKSGEKAIMETPSTPNSQHFETIKSDTEESDEFFEVIDEAMINKIIMDISSHEKNSSK